MKKRKQTNNTRAMLKKKVGVFSCSQHDNCCLNRAVATELEKKERKKLLSSTKQRHDADERQQADNT